MLTSLYDSFCGGNEVLTTLLSLAIFFLCIKLKQSSTSSASKSEKFKLSNNLVQMPSPKSMPIIGHMYLLSDYQDNPWAGFNEIRKKFGDVVSLKMGVHEMVLVSSSGAMKEILLDKGNIFSNRPNFARHHIVFGGDKENSLALCNWSDTHRQRRGFCKRGIVPNKLSSRNQLLETIIIKYVNNFFDTIKNNQEAINSLPPTNTQSSTSPPDHTLVTKRDILFLTSDIFINFLCNEHHLKSDPRYEEFVLGCDYVFWDINQSYLIDFLPFLTSLGVGFSYLKKLKKITDILRNYIDDTIFDPRLRKHIQNTPNESEDEDHDYLDSIILEHLSLATSMSLADYKVGFADLLAGHAAVANILMKLLGHLSINQTAQDLICEESKAMSTRDFDMENKFLLPVTKGALLEALRLASSPIIPHVAREDTSINKFHVPKKSMVLFNNYYLNLSETLWKNPYEFDPLRFLTTVDDSGKPAYKIEPPGPHFMPFSIGKRQCLGFRMVEKISILMVAHLCKKFIIKATDGDLVRKLLKPLGSAALNPDEECFKFELHPRL